MTDTESSMQISNDLYQNILEKTLGLIGISGEKSNLFMMFIVLYFICLFLFILIDIIIKKLYIKNKKNFFLISDEIVYEFAKHQNKENTKENENLKIMESIFSSEKKDYFLDKKNFEETIKRIETKFGSEIISERLIKDYKIYYKKTKLLRSIKSIIGRILTIMTLGIYRIFS